MAIVFAALLLAAATTAPSPCRAEIALEGDAAIVAALRPELERRGACGALRANVHQEGATIMLEMHDAGGRAIHREAHELETAAVIIESWALPLPEQPPSQKHAKEQPAAKENEHEHEHEYEYGHGHGHGHEHEHEREDAPRPEPSARIIEPAIEPVIEKATPQTQTELAPATLELARSTLALSVETSIGSDGSLWAGGRLEGCLSFGPVCTGAALRLDTELRPRTDAERDGDRWFGDAVLMLEAPFSTGTIRVAPGLEVGAGLVHNVFDSPTHEVVVNAIGPRAGAHLTVGFPVSTNAALDFAFAFSFAPSAVTNGQNVEDAYIPGEPRFYLHALIGFQYGVP